jgi:hypothetical protein
MHTVELVAPIAIEYVLARQGMHALAPVTPEYAPAGHFTHASALLAPAAAEYAPAEQFAHAVAPAAPYFPASHATHAPFTVI